MMETGMVERSEQNLVVMMGNVLEGEFETPDEMSLDQQLRESDRTLVDAWVGLTKRSMLIGWEGAFIKRHNGWQRLGYADEKHYRATRVANGIARSTWYKMVGLAERFSELSREQFLSMTIENAEQLAEAPQSVRRDPELIDAAAEMTVRDFESELVRRAALNENKPPSEVYVTIKWRIKQAQREVIERGLEDWQHEHGIDDPGYALELMIAEYRERVTLVGFIAESIPRLTQAVVAAHSVEELEELRRLMAAHIHEMGEILRLCCGEAGSDEEAA
jgi:hypothetical protein